MSVSLTCRTYGQGLASTTLCTQRTYRRSKSSWDPSTWRWLEREGGGGGKVVEGKVVVGLGGGKGRCVGGKVVVEGRWWKGRW